MPKLEDWSPSDPVQILIIGPFKIGKSWFGYTFPRVVSFDFDKGVATARNPEFIKKHGFGHVISYEQFEEKKTGKGGIATAHNAFDDACRYFDEWMKPTGKWVGSDGKTEETGRDMFDTFLIDSGTTLSDKAMNKAAIILGQQSLSKTQESAVKYGLLIPKKQDYGAERSLVEQFTDMILGSGKNVVFICHEKQILDNDQNVTDVGPLLTGKSFQAVPNKFDEVYFLRGKYKGPEYVRYLQTVPDSIRRAGSRYGIPNETVPEYNSLKKEIDRIHAEQEKLKAQFAAGAVSMASTLVTGVK
jgi:hypothetical protein